MHADATTVSLLWACWLLVVRFQRIPLLHFRYYLMSCGFFFLVFPSWSVLSAVDERLLLGTAVLFAEAIGHLIELFLRRRYAA